MHTFRKLPVNKPSRVKASINKANFLYTYSKLDCIRAYDTSGDITKQPPYFGNVQLLRAENIAGYKKNMTRD